MISIVEGNEHLKPYTFNDDYLPLSNDQSIVDSFTAFMEWAISFIQDIVDMVFGPIVDAISNLVDSYCSGVQSALNRAEMDVTSTGSVSSSSLSMLSDALYGDLFLVAFGLVVAVSLALLLLKVVTNVFGFLLNMAISFMISYVALNTIGAHSVESWGYESSEPGLTSVQSFLNNLELATQGSSADDGFGWLLGTIPIEILLVILGFAEAVYLSQSILSQAGVVVGILALILGGYSLAKNDKFTSLVGIILSIENAALAISEFVYNLIKQKSGIEQVSWLILTMFFSGTAFAMSLAGGGWHDQ